MIKLKIKLLAFNNAPDVVYRNAISRIEKLILSEKFELTEADPDVLFFLSGGSEQAAVQHVAKGKFYLLIGSQHDNSYASATEVKAWLNEMNITAMLLDESEPETSFIINNLFIAKQAIFNLKGKKLGQIGEVSDWLISSSIPAAVLQEKLGIRLIVIPWKGLNHYSGFKPSSDFTDMFSGKTHYDLTETAKVNRLLADTIQNHNLDAITVECFPLVQNDGVTACLPLAKFNSEGIPAGCEGDTTAITGMMICRELTGIVPWIANINKVTDKVCVFSHCTISTGLVSDYTVATHFETGKGTAIQGDFEGDLVTIFRFDNKLSKAFIATANISGRPELPSACRTQIEVILNYDDVKLLKQYPLGNHHLIVPGDHKNLLQMLCLILGVEVLG